MIDLNKQYEAVLNSMVLNIIQIGEASATLASEKERLYNTYRVDSDEYKNGVETANNKYQTASHNAIYSISDNYTKFNELLNNTPFDPADTGMLVAIQLAKDENTPDAALETIAERYGSNTQTAELLYSIACDNAKSFFNSYIVKRGDIETMEKSVYDLTEATEPAKIYSCCSEIIRIINIVAKVKKLNVDTSSDAILDMREKNIRARMGLDTNI